MAGNAAEQLERRRRILRAGANGKAEVKLSTEVTMERDVLLNLMKDEEMLNLLPPLRTLKKKQQRKKKGCGCGGRAKTKPNLVQADFEAAKRQIADIASGNRTLQQKLRDRLQTRKVRIKYMKADSSGAVVKKF